MLHWGFVSYSSLFWQEFGQINRPWILIIKLKLSYFSVYTIFIFVYVHFITKKLRVSYQIIRSCFILYCERHIIYYNIYDIIRWFYPVNFKLMFKFSGKIFGIVSHLQFYYCYRRILMEHTILWTFLFTYITFSKLQLDNIFTAWNHTILVKDTSPNSDIVTLLVHLL